MYIITINGKAATVLQLHKHEGWHYDQKEFGAFSVSNNSYIVSRTARDCRDAYECVMGIAWTQKQYDVKTTHINSL